VWRISRRLCKKGGYGQNLAKKELHFLIKDLIEVRQLDLLKNIFSNYARMSFVSNFQ
jgi:hypothetical protein